MKKITVSQELINLKASLNQKLYLSDIPEFSNGLSPLYNTVFNKTVTGIGGTSLALDSSENIIILMPFVEVVNNKEGYNSDTFIVKEGITVAAIVKYLKTTQVRKLVSTYDGLIKITQAYTKAKLNIYDDFLLVDEWQVIFQQYGLRYKSMRYLLDQSVLFKSKCFMTATPIKKEYWFDELIGLEELVLDYNVEPIELRHYKSKDVIDEAIAIINNKGENNLHFFINSVETIKTIVKTLSLSPDLVRIICSKQDKNQYKLTGYQIASTKDPVKSINFYTSTCFEGCDLFDKTAKMYVLCDGSKSHSLVDISTTLSQIAGRIRDIEDTTVNLIYKSGRYVDITEEEFNRTIDINIKSGEIILSEVKSKETLDVLDLNKANDKYLIVEDGKLRFEKTLLNVDKNNFEISKTYSLKANIIAKSSGKFIPVTVNKPWANELEHFEQEKIKKMTFKEKCLQYIEVKDMQYILGEFDKLVVDAVNKLGVEELQRLNYHKGDVTKKLLNFTDSNTENKIMKALSLNKGEFYSSVKLKNTFKNIYSILGINKTAKGTDINNYYFTKPTINSKGERGYTIINDKLNLQ